MVSLMMAVETFQSCSNIFLLVGDWIPAPPKKLYTWAHLFQKIWSWMGQQHLALAVGLIGLCLWRRCWSLWRVTFETCILHHNLSTGRCYKRRSPAFESWLGPTGIPRWPDRSGDGWNTNWQIWRKYRCWLANSHCLWPYVCIVRYHCHQHQLKEQTFVVEFCQATLSGKHRHRLAR